MSKHRDTDTTKAALALLRRYDRWIIVGEDDEGHTEVQDCGYETPRDVALTLAACIMELEPKMVDLPAPNGATTAPSCVVCGTIGGCDCGKKILGDVDPVTLEPR